MLVFNNNGIYCPSGDFYIDPWRPVERALITHAHSDHARWGNRYYLAHHHSIPILKSRLGVSIVSEGIDYGKEININGIRISFFPAGHVPGSAQIRLESNGKIWVVSGDYKLQNDQFSTPFEPVKCHHFITESTFGLPHYRFPDPDTVHHDINEWWRSNAASGKVTVLAGYALGKAQRLIKHLDPSIGKIWVHGAVAIVNDLLLSQGYSLPSYEKVNSDTPKSAFAGSIVVAPPSAIGTSWMKKFEPYRVGIASGWMQLRGTRRRQAADRGFILSDHADWDALNKAVLETGAENIYVTHGYKSTFARWLREHHGLQATEVDTLYEGEEPDAITEEGGGDEEIR